MRKEAPEMRELEKLQKVVAPSSFVWVTLLKCGHCTEIPRGIRGEAT